MKNLLYREDNSVVLSVFDVARYIVKKIEPIEIWKLQKLVYYCQAWSLVWLKRPIFNERIEAWSNGPVCPELHERIKNYYELDSNTPIWGDINASSDDRDVMDVVIRDYGDKPHIWLRELTHMEEPWKRARKDVPYMDKCNNEITNEMMATYYGSL